MPRARIARLLSLVLLMAGLAACASKKPGKVRRDIEDFSLTGAALPQDFGTAGYGSVDSNHSFPLSLKAGQGRQTFAGVPAAARPARSHWSGKVGNCVFFISTGELSVDRYLYVGRWIKMRSDLQSGMVRLENGAYGNFKTTGSLRLSIPARTKRACHKAMYGRRLSLGAFHLNASTWGLLAAPGSPPVRFTQSGPPAAATRVYLRWHKGWSQPRLEDEFEMPPEVEGRIVRTRFARDGFYYLVFAPRLERATWPAQTRKRLRKKRRRAH